MLELVRTQTAQSVAVTKYQISPRMVKLILLFPFIITVIFTVALILPPTRNLAKLWVEENYPVELFTFVSMIAGSILGGILAQHVRKSSQGPLVFGFYLFFALCLFVIAMEEVAWGQWFFGFNTPDEIENINMQGELTLHNIDGLHGRSEFLRIGFGFGGLLGIWFARFPMFSKVSPPVLLGPWFIIVIILAIPDLLNDWYVWPSNIHNYFEYMSEVNEMLIGFGSLIFIWLNARFLRCEWRKDQRA